MNLERVLKNLEKKWSNSNITGEIWWGDDDGPEALTREQEVLEQKLIKDQELINHLSNYQLEFCEYDYNFGDFLTVRPHSGSSSYLWDLGGYIITGEYYFNVVPYFISTDLLLQVLFWFLSSSNFFHYFR